MSETYTEPVEAEPIKRAAREGAGRRREANPLEGHVKSVLGQKNEDGTPKTVATTFTLNTEAGETIEQRSARIRRLLTRAGKELVAAGQDPAKIDRAISGPDESGVYTLKISHKQ